MARTDTPQDLHEDEGEDSLAEASPEPFEDPTLQRAYTEDPIARFFLSNWRQVGMIVLACFALWYVKTSLEASHRATLEQAADSYVKVKTEFEALESFGTKLKTARTDVAKKKTEAAAAGLSAEKQTEANEAVKKAETEVANLEKQESETKEKLQQFLTVLADKEGSYKLIAGLYRGILAHRSGDITMAKQALSQITWEDKKDLQSGDRFFGELASLTLAKILIDSDATYAEGRELLKALADRGAVLGPAAVLTLSRVSTSPEEKKEAHTLLRSVQTRFPEQQKLLDPESKRLAGLEANG